MYKKEREEHNMKDNKKVTVNINIFTILTIVFVVLKIIGKITWSWIWVLAPLWIPDVLVTVVGLIIFIGIKIADFFDR